MRKIKITARNLTNEEEAKYYGPREIEVGKCFISEDGKHRYMQRENDVLHVKSGIINSLSEGHLNKGEFREISREEFVLTVKEQIYNMELDNFWKINNNG